LLAPIRLLLNMYCPPTIVSVHLLEL